MKFQLFDKQIILIDSNFDNVNTTGNRAWLNKNNLIIILCLFRKKEH